MELQPLTPAVVAQLDSRRFRAGQRAAIHPGAGCGSARPAVLPADGGQRSHGEFAATAVGASVSPSPAVATPNGKVPGHAAAPSASKTEIPALLLRPWEFRRTRDETIAGLRRASSWVARLTRPLRRLCYHAEFRKWQLLLSGRSAEEQLWGVPPPRGWLGDPWLRDWARHTLELGGYDSNVLLAEWEVFWGRKVT